MHDFVGLHGIGFFDAHKNQIVKHTFSRQGDVHDLREIHLEDGQKQRDACSAKVKILHWWLPYDGARVHGIAAMCDGRNVKRGIVLRQGVIASMISERAFTPERFRRVDIALNHDVRIGGHLEIVGFAFHERHGLAAEVAGQQQFIKSVGQRSGGAKRIYRVAAQKNTDRHPLPFFVITSSMSGGNFLELPMHASGLVVKDLHSVHTDIARAGVGILCYDAG